MPQQQPGQAEGDGQRPEREWFEGEVTRLMDRLYGTALRLARHPQDAEDLVAEAVAAAWKKRSELRDRNRFEGWLFRILNNTFVSQLRRRRSRQDREVDIESAGNGGQDGDDFSLFAQLHQPFLLWWGTPEEEFVSNLLLEDIQRALDGLPDAFRVVVVLVEVQGYTYDEVSQLLEVPVGTVRSRLSRGRSLLQKALWQQARAAGIRAASGETAGNDGDDR